MKRIMCAAVMIVMILSLAACGGKSQSATLTYDESGYYMTYQLDAKGDIVHTITQTTTLDASVFSEADIQALQSSLSEYAAIYGAYDSVTYTTDLSNNVFSETIIIDLTNTDELSSLIEAGLVPIEGGSTVVSLEKTVDSLTSLGWALQE